MSLKSRQARRRRIEAAQQTHAASTSPVAPDPASILAAPNTTSPEVVTLHEAVVDHLQKPEYHSATARNVMAGHGLRRGFLDVLKADQAARAKARPAAAKTN